MIKGEDLTFDRSSDKTLAHFAPYRLFLDDSERATVIGETLELLRRKARLTQKDLSALMGIAPQTYNGYEKGKHAPSVELLIRFAYLYDVDMDYLTGRYKGVNKEFENEINKLENELDEQTILGLQFQVAEMREELDQLKQAFQSK